MKKIQNLILLFLIQNMTNAEVALATNTSSFSCNNLSSGNKELITLMINKSKTAFNISANSESKLIFTKNNQRPSLNVRIADTTNSTINEFIDFNDFGFEIIPVDSKTKLEIDFALDSTLVHYEDGIKSINLKCNIDLRDLVLYLAIKPTSKIPTDNIKAVAFDIDDTLMFTSPAFERGFATGRSPKPEDLLFWTHTNGCDKGCPATTITLNDGSTKKLPENRPSTPKLKALELIAYHKSLGHKIYAITARPDINGDPLRDYLVDQLGIERKNIFFEPDIDQQGNAAGKTDRIENLDLDIFYGDSDSDITDTLKAFVSNAGVRSKTVHAIRFLRSPFSSNRKAGKLNKYHPGYYGEPIIEGSY